MRNKIENVDFKRSVPCICVEGKGRDRMKEVNREAKGRRGTRKGKGREDSQKSSCNTYMKGSIVTHTSPCGQVGSGHVFLQSMDPTA